MASMWKLRNVGIGQYLKTLARDVGRVNIVGRSAELSYYFLLALFPLLMFMLSMLGLLDASGVGIRTNLIQSLSRIAPASAAQLISDTMDQILKASDGKKVLLGLIGALWAASSGMSAICDTLNDAYGVTETRKWWRVRMVAIKLTTVLSAVIVGALSLVLFERTISDRLSRMLGMGDSFNFIFQAAEWLIVVAFIIIGYDLVYYSAPNVARRSWSWGTPGAVLGAAIWVAGSFGFRLYLHYFNSFSRTYGSLGAVIILLLWFYFTGASILIGGAVNAGIEREAGETVEASGKPLQERAPDRMAGEATQS